MKESITTGVTEMEKTVNNNVDDASLALAKQVLINPIIDPDTQHILSVKLSLFFLNHYTNSTKQVLIISPMIIDPDKQKMCVKLSLFSYILQLV